MSRFNFEKKKRRHAKFKQNQVSDYVLVLFLSSFSKHTTTMGILNGDIPLNSLRFIDNNLPTDTSIQQVSFVHCIKK
jgi:ABC-type microcin C transport system permease subunit YejE